ncbi:short chain dehydrogenase [Gemmatimonadetes bacterium T265]|nr:short chain dehydrogenase [Gemmatimonadetes bacterium T265]
MPNEPRPAPPPADPAFEGRVALVTGAGSGIGRAAALALARRGARLVLGDVSDEGLAGTRAALDGAGVDASRVRAARTDVRRDADLAALVALAAGAPADGFGRLDFALNSAGVGGVEARAADYPEDDWVRTIDVNLTGVWRSMRHEIPAMLATVRAHGGTTSVVNVASVAGLNGFPRHAAYAASKHGVIGLTRSAALEYAASGVRVNALCPGFTATPMVERITRGDAAREARLTARVPLGRLGTVDEVAAAVVYLCSDAAAFMVGHAMVVDGGITAG